MIQAALLFAQGAFGVGSALQTLSAGDAQARQLKLEAKREEVNATIRNNERLERLVNSMAINNASLAARGITSEGSPMAILKSDWLKYGQDAQRDLMQSQVTQLTLKARARSAQSMARLNAATSLLGTAIDIGKTGFTPKTTQLTAKQKAEVSADLDNLILNNPELF